ncbi:hypothetical protein ABEF95_003012 [Exophiala dermatitidis]
MDDETLARVEQQRTELESNIAKLRKALRHWQTLEIDYEGLKEEFLGLPDDAPAEECLQAAKDFKPEAIDDKELQELLTDSKSRPRRPAQLVDLLSKRVDYVTRNVETVRKQLSEAEKKRNVLLLAEDPNHQEDAGLPLAEITEELDESGEVISGKVETPGASTNQLIDALRRAGVEDLKETDGEVTSTDNGSRKSPPALDPPTSTSQQQDLTNTSAENEHNPTETTLSEDSVDEIPANPNDTETEAQLRREMWEYSQGLDEVGAIVAELDLEEDASDVSYDEQDEPLDLGSDFDDDFDDEESEDETGKSTHPLTVPRAYRKKMEELQEKLGLKNMGPQAATQIVEETLKQSPRPPAAEAARKAAIARDEKSKKSSLKSAVKSSVPKGDGGKAESSNKKKVAFSSELDIASDEPSTKSTPVASTTPKKPSQAPKVRPINESIVEREVAPVDEDNVFAPAPTSRSEKPSRFKAARQTQPQTPMFAPPMSLGADLSRADQDEPISPTPTSKIISANLVERPSSRIAKAPDPDDFSEEAHRQEVAIEYQRHRMKRILAQEHGFTGNGEGDNYGEMITPGRGHDDEDGKGKKISRFKAARISRQMG